MATRKAYKGRLIVVAHAPKGTPAPSEADVTSGKLTGWDRLDLPKLDSNKVTLETESGEAELAADLSEMDAGTFTRNMIIELATRDVHNPKTIGLWVHKDDIEAAIGDGKYTASITNTRPENKALLLHWDFGSKGFAMVHVPEAAFTEGGFWEMDDERHTPQTNLTFRSVANGKGVHGQIVARYVESND